MTNELPDVVYVDLIEDKPKTREEFAANWPGDGDVDDEPDEDLSEAYVHYLNRFQPFHWHAENAGNHKIGALGERYFNEADAIANIQQQYGSQTIVYLRRAEHGNLLLRMAYPLDQGEIILLGPDVHASSDGSVITWKGVEYRAVGGES
jgi:hypothetical protein